MPITSNVYAAPDNVPIGDYVAVVGRSDAPSWRYDDRPEFVQDDGFMDHPGGEWAPRLDGGSNGIPDAHRNRVMPLYQYRPPTENGAPPEAWWNGPHGPGEEGLLRHRAVETVDGDGWRAFRGDMSRKRAIPDIRRTPPAEVRKTSDMAPVTYNYTRPFDQDIAHTFNGQHFSMADHRRNYEIYGMQPVSNRRNTYRADPMPWDTDIVDRVPSYTPTQARITQVNLPTERSWRAY
jgi:hypothetical protein